MIGGPNSDAHEQPVPMNRHAKDQPLIPAFSPYEGEKENLSLVLERANDSDLRDFRVHVVNARKSARSARFQTSRSGG